MTTAAPNPYAAPARQVAPSVFDQYPASGVNIPMNLSRGASAIANYRAGGGRPVGADPGAAAPLRSPAAGIPGGERATPTMGLGGMAPDAASNATGGSAGATAPGAMPSVQAPTGSAPGVPTTTAAGGVLRPPRSTASTAGGPVMPAGAQANPNVPAYYRNQLAGIPNAGGVRPGSIRPPTLVRTNS